MSLYGLSAESIDFAGLLLLTASGSFASCDLDVLDGSGEGFCEEDVPLPALDTE